MDQAAQLRPGFFGLAVRRRWRLIVAGGLLGLIAGVGALSQLPVTYTSTSSLFLNPLVGNPYAPDLGTSRTDQLTALQTESELIPTERVSELAMAASPVALPDDPENNLSVVVPSNSQVVDISFTAGKSEVAAAGAQAFADAYLQYRAIRAAEANASQAELLRGYLENNSTLIDDTQTQLAAAEPDSSTALNLQGQLGVYSEQQAELTLSLLEATGAIPPAGEVISPASSALTPSGFPAWLVLLAALLVGLGFGGVIALAREHADERVRDADELTAVGVGHALATVPLGRGTFPLDRPAPPGYRLLLSGVMARTGVDAPITCVVGRTAAAQDVAAGLAGAAYRLDKHAIAIGIDAPDSWQQARVLPAQAIVEASGRVVTPYEEQPTVVVVPLDLTHDSAEEFVLSPALPRFVIGARTTGSVVSLAGGSSASAAGQTMASIANLTVVVVELGRDTFSEIVEVVETLHEAGVEHVGLVVLEASTSRSGLLGRFGRGLSARTVPNTQERPVAVAPRPVTGVSAASAPGAGTSLGTGTSTGTGTDTGSSGSAAAPAPAPREVTAPGSARR